MSEIENTTPSGLNRRQILKGAAWSVPVLAAAVATPLASASTTNASLAWTDSSTGLLALRVLDGGGLITAQALVTVPTQFTLTNGPGAIDETGTVTVVVGRPTGINLPVGRARGFGVASLGGVDVAAQNTAVYNTVLGARVGFPITEFTGAHHFTVADGQPLQVPIEFGLSGSNSGITVGLLSNFPVTITVAFANGSTYSASTGISVPVGAGIL